MINSFQNNRSNIKDAGTNLAFLLIGGGIGATIALLFAPKSGKEFRQDVSEGVKYGLDTAGEKISQAKDIASEKVSHLREVADDYYHKAQDKVSEVYRVAVKPVTDGTAEAKSSVNNSANNFAVQAQSVLTDVSNEPKEPPLFESGSNPSDQRSAKTGF